MNIKRLMVVRPTRMAAVLLTVALAVSGVVAGIGSTFAAQGDVVVELKCESGISSTYTMEAGASKTMTATYLYQAYSSNSDVMGVKYSAGNSLDNLSFLARAAGVASVSYTTNTGMLSLVTYQVTDSGNISKYTLKDNGELYFPIPETPATGVSKAVPVTVNTAANEGRLSTVSWSSMNENVAKVNASTGIVTAVGKGATIIVGNFTDKWGEPRVMQILVGVGVYLSGSDYTITGVSVVPPGMLTVVPEVSAGSSLQFRATVQGDGNVPQDVTWQVSGNNSSGTGISAGGLLRMASDESAEYVTIRATSAFDASKYKDVFVDIRYPESDFSISPSGFTIMLSPGGSLKFSATLDSTGKQTAAVSWQVFGAISSETSINALGELKIANDEPHNSFLTVRCTYLHGEKSHDVTVRVVPPAPAP